MKEGSGIRILLGLMAREAKYFRDVSFFGNYRSISIKISIVEEGTILRSDEFGQQLFAG